MASLLLGDLNDYIQPAELCIKPATSSQSNEQKKENVTIDLTDCLACHGCVTSAESILVAQQTHQQLLDQIMQNRNGAAKAIVVSISPQTRAAVALRYKLDLLSTAKKLTFFLI